MAYMPKTWVNSDPITASDLNRIETGISTLDTQICTGAFSNTSDIAAGASATYTVTLPVSMPSTSYTVVATLKSDNANARALNVWATPATTTTFTAGISNSSSVSFPSGRYVFQYIAIHD